MPASHPLAIAYAAAQRAAARSDLDLLVAVTAAADGERVVVVPRSEAEVVEPAVLDDLPASLVAAHTEVLAENAVRALVEDAREARTLRGRLARALDALRGDA